MLKDGAGWPIGSIRNGLANGGVTSFIICQSSMLRLPGNDCSIVSLTSGPISRAHVAKKTAGLVWAVEIMVCLPCEAQTSARSFRKPGLNTVRLPTGLPLRLPD